MGLRYTRYSFVVFSALFVSPIVSRLDSVTMRYSSSSLVLWLLLLLSVSLATMTSISLESFCHTACKVGRGGNVCRCRNGQFIGKRSQLSSAFDSGGPMRFVSGWPHSMTAQPSEPTTPRSFAIDAPSFPTMWHSRRHH